MYTILNGILVVTPGHALWVGRGQKLNFSEHSHVTYQFKGDDE